MMDKNKLIAFLKGRLFPTPCDSYDDGRDFAYQDVLDEVEAGFFDKDVTP